MFRFKTWFPVSGGKSNIYIHYRGSKAVSKKILKNKKKVRENGNFYTIPVFEKIDYLQS